MSTNEEKLARGERRLLIALAIFAVLGGAIPNAMAIKVTAEIWANQTIGFKVVMATTDLLMVILWIMTCLLIVPDALEKQRPFSQLKRKTPADLPAVGDRRGLDEATDSAQAR